MFEAGAALIIVAVGALGLVGLVALAAVRVRKTNATASKLVDLALGGRPDEARVQARNASADLTPLLEALGGDLSIPKPRRAPLELASLALVPLPVLTLCGYAWRSLHGAQESKLALARGLLVGVAILLPLTLAVGHALLVIGSWGRRSVRGACITLLAKNVKGAVDTETAEALRRGTNLRDPRGE